MPEQNTRAHAIEKLRSLMKGIKFCMLTTVDDDHLRSRPMALQQAEFDGDLWFFTGRSTDKSVEISHDAHVNVSFANPDDNQFVSLSGRARLVDDRAKAEQLWSVFYRAWFPGGLDDPDLVLIKVEVDRAEYWDSPDSTVVQLYGLAKAMLTGERPDPGAHEKLELQSGR
jgi:general stress protein 26